MFIHRVRKCVCVCATQQKPLAKEEKKSKFEWKIWFISSYFVTERREKICILSWIVVAALYSAILPFAFFSASFGCTDADDERRGWPKGKKVEKASCPARILQFLAKWKTQNNNINYIALTPKHACTHAYPAQAHTIIMFEQEANTPF